MKDRTARYQILLAVLSLVVFVTLCEGIVRIVGPDTSLPASKHHFRFDQANQLGVVYHVRDDRLGWRLMPNQRIRMQMEDGGGGVFRTNEHGLRGRDFAIGKPPGVVRVLVVGDSNAMGYGIGSDEAIYSSGVEILLNRHFEGRGPRFEAINMGVDGYSSHQARLLVEDYVPRMSPDFVCLQVGFNDHCLSVVPDADHAFDRPWLLETLERSMAYRWARRTLLVAIGAHERTYAPVPRVSVDAFDENVRAIVATSRRAGAEVLLLTTPARFGYPLTINEIPVEENGTVTWMTEKSWIDERLRAGGLEPPDQPADPRYAAVVARALDAHPDWATLHVMRARGLLARGELAAAEAAQREALAHDRERSVLASYMDRLRKVAEEEPGTELIDVGAALRRTIGGEMPRLGDETKDLFLDFVHLDERGQVVVAKAIAEIVAQRVSAR